MTRGGHDVATIPVALTIAGSDSGAGAGIQADLKAIASFGVYGTSVITAVTAQNTVAVTAVADLDPGVVAAQMRGGYSTTSRSGRSRSACFHRPESSGPSPANSTDRPRQWFWTRS